MTRKELAQASGLLERAADDADGAAAETLREQADQLARLAEQERAPDHGRLARHQAVLRDVKDRVDGGVGSRIEVAYDLINRHRETLEGV